LQKEGRTGNRTIWLASAYTIAQVVHRLLNHHPAILTAGGRFPGLAPSRVRREGPELQGSSRRDRQQLHRHGQVGEEVGDCRFVPLEGQETGSPPLRALLAAAARDRLASFATLPSSSSDGDAPAVLRMQLKERIWRRARDEFQEA
jgi:hypothetical protein